MKWLGIFFAAWYLWLPITFVFGRKFCRWCCPLGLSQTLISAIFHPKTRVRQACALLPRGRGQRIVNWVLVAVYFLAPLGFWLNPWGIFGRVLIGFVPGVILFAAILLLAVFGRGRIWCNWICPFGTLFDLAAKLGRLTPFGRFSDRPGKSCANCRACFGEAKAKNAAENSGITRREALHGCAVLAAVETAEKTVDGGYADVSLPGVPPREMAVLPPGSGKREDYARKCIACGLCVLSCPEKVLKPSMRLKNFGQPEMDFREGHCLIGCTKCTEVCPVGAMERLRPADRVNVHMGEAIWRKELCVRTTVGDNCTACVRKCPVKAIHLVEGFPVVDRGACIGCGACEHVCPARPQPAIYVKGFEMQRTVKPMDEGDLIAEMRALIKGGAAVVVAQNGVIAGRKEGRGIAPLMELLDEGKLNGATVVDKVIGRAAAAMCIVGGARRVAALRMSEDAAALLARHGIAFEADERVAKILNRDQSDRCPMEKAVDALDDPKQMVETLRKAIKK